MDRVLVRAGVASALFGLTLFSGCGAGGGGGSGGADPTLTFAITDSASSTVESFTLDVTNIQLTKLGGAVVNILSNPTTIDLASLTDTSQVLSGSTVPAGTYLNATITLDFTNAQCFLVGQSTPAAITDAAGNPLTGPLTLPIHFGTNALHCPFNRHKLLEFDFDLNQSVISDTVGNSVTVEPAFEMHVDPTAPKTLIAYGTLTSVDTTGGTFVGQLETLAGTPITSATFHPDTNTIYQIDGVPSQGSAGLTALAGVAAGTWIQCYGSVDPLSPQLDVSFVESGFGTYNGGTDIVEGLITDRTGGVGTDPQLTVLGHSNDATHTIFQFNTSFLVSGSFANTKVVRFGVNQAFDCDDLNVGQRVRVFGTLAGTNMDATGARDVIRMQPTWVLGHANGAPVPPDLQIDLARVDLRDQSVFNWSASGSTPPDPTHFNLLVNNLGTGLNITSTTPVAARGFFPATILQNLSQVPSLMLVRNRPAGFTVDVTASITQITIGITGTAGTGEFAIIDQPLVGSQPLPTSPIPTIVGASSGPTYFAIRDNSVGSTTLYLLFGDFTFAVNHLITAGAVLDQISAVGVYAGTSNTIEAQLAMVVVN
jgi:Domain of unknown function (DUF4382)